MTVADLPGLNACLNGLATLLLVLGMVAIKRERKDVHGYLMGAAFVVSCSMTLTFDVVVWRRQLTQWNMERGEIRRTRHAPARHYWSRFTAT